MKQYVINWCHRPSWNVQMELQGIHRRVVQFKKLLKTLFLTLHVHNIHFSSGNCPSFSRATGSRFSCLLRSRENRFPAWVSCTDWKYIILLWCVYSKLCTKLTPHCNHRSGHIKTELTESLLLMRRHIGHWSRGPAVSMRSDCCAPFFCVCPV
jgi:hypothetical protein